MKLTLDITEEQQALLEWKTAQRNASTDDPDLTVEEFVAQAVVANACTDIKRERADLARNSRERKAINAELDSADLSDPAAVKAKVDAAYAKIAAEDAAKAQSAADSQVEVSG